MVCHIQNWHAFFFIVRLFYYLNYSIPKKFCTRIVVANYFSNKYAMFFVPVSNKNQFYHSHRNKIFDWKFRRKSSPQRHEAFDVQMPMKPLMQFDVNGCCRIFESVLSYKAMNKRQLLLNHISNQCKRVRELICFFFALSLSFLPKTEMQHQPNSTNVSYSCVFVTF